MADINVDNVFFECFIDRINEAIEKATTDVIKIVSICPLSKDFEFDGTMYSSFYLLNKNRGREMIGGARILVKDEHPEWHLFAICTNGETQATTHLDVIVSRRPESAKKHHLWIEYTGVHYQQHQKKDTSVDWNRPVYDMRDFPVLHK